MKARHVLIAFDTLLIAILACSIPAGQGTPTADLAATIAAQASTLTAVAQPTVQGTPTSTPTPGVAQVTVSSTTNCRVGPGVAWDVVVEVNPGQTFEVVGKNTATNYWIINIPGHGTCWLWGQYAVKTGGDVAEVEVPATAEAAAAAPAATDTPWFHLLEPMGTFRALPTNTPWFHLLEPMGTFRVLPTNTPP